MKRHSALASLSRDHHHALVVAQRLKRAGKDTATGARETFLEYWRADGQRHFREEEEILLPAYAGSGNPDQSLVARVLIDHVRIRRLADQLAGGSEDVSVLHRLGAQLEEHVRREERELFPLIEQAIPEAELARLAQRLS